MKAQRAGKVAEHVITLPGHAHPFLIAMLVVATGVAATAILTIIQYKLPVYLNLLLFFVSVSCAMIVLTCTRYFKATALKLGESALEVSGPSGKQTFPWSKIESVKVVGATGCLADDPLKPAEKRLGLALFLRGGHEGRSEASEADVILCSGEMDNGSLYLDASTSISKAIRKRGVPQGRGRATPRIGGASRKAMDRTPRKRVA